MQSPTVLAVMLAWMLFRTSMRAVTAVAEGVVEVGTWMALGAMGVVLVVEWVMARSTTTPSRR